MSGLGAAAAPRAPAAKAGTAGVLLGPASAQPPMDAAGAAAGSASARSHLDSGWLSLAAAQPPPPLAFAANAGRRFEAPATASGVPVAPPPVSPRR